MKEPALESLQQHFPHGFVLVYVTSKGTFRLAKWNPDKLTAFDGIARRIESNKGHVETEQLLDDTSPKSREELK